MSTLNQYTWVDQGGMNPKSQTDTEVIKEVQTILKTN